MRRFVAFILSLVLLFILSGCSEAYDKAFKGSRLAIGMMEDAIEVLDKCRTDSLSAEATVDELGAIAGRYDTSSDDSKAKHASLIIRSAVCCLEISISENNNTVLDTAQQLYDSLCESLYSK